MMREKDKRKVQDTKSVEQNINRDFFQNSLEQTENLAYESKMIRNDEKERRRAEERKRSSTKQNLAN